MNALKILIVPTAAATLVLCPVAVSSGTAGASMAVPSSTASASMAVPSSFDLHFEVPNKFVLGEPFPQYVPAAWIDEVKATYDQDVAPFEISWNEAD